MNRPASEVGCPLYPLQYHRAARLTDVDTQPAAGKVKNPQGGTNCNSCYIADLGSRLQVALATVSYVAAKARRRHRKPGLQMDFVVVEVLQRGREGHPRGPAVDRTGFRTDLGWHICYNRRCNVCAELRRPGKQLK